MRLLSVWATVAAVTLLLLAVVMSSAMADESDRVTDLPGYDQQVPFKHYAGYLTVDAAHNRNLFYWYFQSQRSPATDPVVLWLNGGPGCSSLTAALEENGPFWPNPDLNVQPNPFSWNRYANMLYLESPAGVGFSYSDNLADYTTNDNKTASDSYLFLQKFFAKYPDLQGRPFWITGESYAGHYVPDLAMAILQGNADRRNIDINLVGFMIGNPYTWGDVNQWGTTRMWWNTATISNSTYISLNQYCGGPFAPSVDPAECDAAQQVASKEAGNIDMYDLYRPVCLSSGDNAAHRLVRKIAEANPHSPYRIVRDVHDRVQQSVRLGDTPADPCIDNWVTGYLNRPDVQAALHVTRRTLPPKFRWNVCSDAIDYSQDSVARSMLPTYVQLFPYQLRILLYSGDVDSVVPFTSTRTWLGQLLTRNVNYRAWTINNQVGGRVEEYTDPTGRKVITFTTIRFAGHLAPSTQPERAMNMFQRFLDNVPL